MQNLVQPTLLLKPFAENGDKNDIPLNNETIAQPQLADLTVGFPPITSKDPADGGLPPERNDFNALGYLTTTYDYFYQAGGTFTFNSTISNAIGGYPLNARLWYTDSNGVSCILRSTIANNTNDFTQDDSVIGETGSGKPWEVENFRGISSKGNLFDCKWSDHIMNDVSWLRADTFSWQSGSVYVAAYNHLVDDLGTTDQTTYYAWTYRGDYVYTTSSSPSVGDNLYEYLDGEMIYDASSIAAGNISAISGNEITNENGYIYERSQSEDITISGAQTETVGSYTITYYLAADGHKICLPDQETTAVNIYNESGVAWYYILDTANQRFKLPMTKYGFVGVRDTVGKYVPESLPNIKGKVYARGIGGGADVLGWESGCIQRDSSDVIYTGNVTGSGGTEPAVAYKTNASLSSSVYQDNAPVQQRAAQMYLYFYVGNYNQSAIEQTAGLNTELFNGKVDLNAANLSTQGKSLISGLGMPSNRYIDLTLLASGGQYTALANGYFIINYYPDVPALRYFRMINITKGYSVTNHSGSVTFRVDLVIPVLKGDIVQCDYNTTGTIECFRFYYAEGESSV
ncbi:MAG: hypothetical protein J6S67_10015 [Methanobrevibacter sp.]|nr:hypothetical protein [Methanobrevibacter sp.]